MSRILWLLALIGSAAIPSLGGQSLERLQARADSLAREWRQATVVADAVDSVERARALAGRDTIRVGALTIVADPSPLPLREAAGRAWPVIDSLYGSEAQQLEQRPYLIVPVDPDTTVERPRIHSGIAITWDEDAAPLALLLLSNVPIARPDTAWRSWLGGAVLPMIHAAQRRAGVYVELVTAPSQAARRCFLGDLSACRDALDLAGDANRLQRWYPSAPERRALVLRLFSGFFFNRASQEALEACRQGHDAPCLHLLGTLAPGELPRPLPYDARATLVDLALRVGGREAYHRLVASAGAPINDRLAAAAGVRVDSLVARWRAEIVGSRPVPVTLPPWGPWIAVGWIGVFTACGLRSSRWRIS